MKARLILGVLLMTIDVLCKPAAANPQAACTDASAAKVEQELRASLDLSARIEAGRAAGRDVSAWEAERRISDDEVLPPCLERAVDLVRDTDAKLGDIIFDVAVAQQNLADERTSWSLGRLFGYRTDIVSEQLKRFDGRVRNQLISGIYFGWLNVRDDFPTEIQVARDAAILALAKQYDVILITAR
ncbi:MAG: hypothetical protein IT548_07725 [Alphaproteobacteria bacterium]|nr:hypothetical protein [Alphaproteobacteria bacterium]